MAPSFRFSLILGAAVLSALMSGCAGSYQARSVDLKEYSSFLVNPNLLQKGTGDEALYRYFNPDADLKKYSKVLILPVLICKEAKLDKDELENYQKLANNAFVYLNQQLAKQMTVVNEAGPDTAIFQMAIVDADNSAPVRNLMTSVMPMGIGLNILKYAATGKQIGVGEITAEIRVTDSLTGDLLVAVLDRRVGGKNPKGIYSTWSNADAALQYWAERSAYVVCTRQGGEQCAKP